MFLSVFEILKVSVGPSSSHTMGPMLAAGRFVQQAEAALIDDAEQSLTLRCTLYGSLAFTGEGHGTHGAVLAGLLGCAPQTYDSAEVAQKLAALAGEECIDFAGCVVGLDPQNAIISDRKTRLPAHPNGMRFCVERDDGEVVLEEVYYSVGGGFVLTEAELKLDSAGAVRTKVPHAFNTADEMLEMGDAAGLSIAEMKRANEMAASNEVELDDELLRIWGVMSTCIDRGLNADGELPGGLHVRRRAGRLAKGMHEKLNTAPLHQAVDWISAYAMAVNEENAAGGQVVTAPTNGAAGVLPATIRYYLDHVPGAEEVWVPDMLLTAAAIGGLIKYNASISGAEVGCQGEVGSASAMAAAALCAALGGNNAQIENAAEIALEHHLGMTCDPVRGLVQVPCIERNGLGAVKAVTAASLALAGDGQHIVSLDACIDTMRQTGRDMDEKYKETSLGGLSVSVPDC